MGYIDYLQAGVYEATHKQFKEIHRSTSNRHGSEMREALNKHGFRTNYGIGQSDIIKEKVIPRNNQSKTKQSNETEHLWLDMDRLLRW